jgi:DNA-nicking Smr family endonuclease
MPSKKTQRKRAHRLIEQGKRAISVRLTGLSRPKIETPNQRTAAPDMQHRVHPLATLLDDVVPLPGPHRVPKGAVDHAGKRKKRALVAVKRFVIQRDELRVEAYREDLGPAALAPLSSARWAPQDRLDLHGKRAHGVQVELVRALGERARSGIRRLLVIHGKGLHAASGVGVLGELVVEALTAAPAAARVRAFCTAPSRLGGHGALLVELDIAAVDPVRAR